MSLVEDSEFQPSETVGTSPKAVLSLCSLLVGAFFIWSIVTELDIVSMTTGVIAPLSQLKTVQHLEGGIVRDILVREGEEVSVDQPLVVLEPTATGADVGELQVRLTALKADISRFDALLSSKKIPVYPNELIENHPQIVEQSIQRFKAQYQRHQSELTRQKETIQHRIQEIREIKTRIENSKRSLMLMQEQVSISDEMMLNDLTNRFVHLNLLKEAELLRGSVAKDNQALVSARLALKEAEAEQVFINSKFLDDNAGSLDEAQRTYSELFQRIQKFEPVLLTV